MTPDEVIQHMNAGNECFRSGKPQHRDLMRELKATTKAQYPAAILFSCIDSRAPAEFILDLVLAKSLVALVRRISSPLRFVPGYTYRNALFLISA